MLWLANMVGTQALALVQKEINTEGPCYVRLVGRKSGVVDWLLTVIGINTTTVLEVYGDRIEYSYGSLSGRVVEMIPLSKVSNLLCGRFKPAILLILAGICFAAAFVTFGITLIFTILFVIFYFLKKTVLISIIPNSGSASSVAFKRSLIEGKDISEEEAANIIKIVAQLVEYANKK